MRTLQKWILAFILLVVLLIAGTFIINGVPSDQPAAFDGDRAYSDLTFQMELGPRIPLSEAHRKVVDWAEDNFKEYGWTTYRQNGIAGSHDYINLTATRGSGYPWIIIAAHYDSRLWADQDANADNRKFPVPGANDGASGVAVITELARDLPKELNRRVDLVLLDAEDNGNIDDWDWILGSREYVKTLIGKPDAVIILDMIGDKDLNIYREKNSTASLTDEIWNIAKGLGYEKQFIDTEKYSMEDDHTPFLQAGIPAVDVIDFDYPYWHTTQDMVDKTSAASLKAVGDTILKFIMTFQVPVSTPVP
jgi:Zn-dependent M28 family amino/carboxypeptidase